MHPQVAKPQGSQWRCLSLALLLAGITTGAAFAGDAIVKEAATGDNIFGCPEQAQTVPSFTEGTGRGEKIRKLLLGNNKDDIPDFRQVRIIPSLTAAQRKEIQSIYGARKEDLQRLQEQGRKLRQKFGADRSALVNPEARMEIEKIAGTVRELRRSTWEQVKTKLSPEQIAELQSMRKGELQPATFNEPMTGMGEMRK